ncbi:hypothetical protein PVAND_001533 [Polypedilum vanderplanki]|uniref:Fatty acyl-CoA reductase n=1 Tax=Polypedilum vanderplanki TaxID=319348 RepID=A0A9J6BNH9_POLVA|nr:hypothetical protein PVAND_001533 [Polypedilum vanderplanki]
MITIPEFYRNRDVFITGATGFIMKVLIEKLFRSCSDVGRIFVLMREKRSKSINERLEDIKKMALFSLLLEKNPEIFNKLVPIEGDVTKNGMALSEESREMLKNVSIIFHSAASVRFDDNLKDAVILNTRGTLETIKFALTLKNLISFIHVSTTYCYPNRESTNEEVYPVECDWQKTIELAEKFDMETLECFMPHYTGFLPNTYVFTKALAEKICESYKEQLPITIVRPSIVVGTEIEPFGGWCDNYNGPVGLLTACGIGIMRTMHASWEAILNCVAVDVVAKTVIVAAWKSAMENAKIQSMVNNGSMKQCNEQLRVYNCASLHNMSLKLLVYEGQYAVRKFPFEKIVYMPGGGVTLCRFMNYFRIVCFQLTPAALIDLVLKLYGKKPFLLSLQRKIAHASSALKTFVHTEWNFGVENFEKLRNGLLPEDEETFSLQRKIEKDIDYYEVQILGARRYLLKECDSTLPACRRRIKYLLIFDTFMRFLLFGYIFYRIANKFGIFINYEGHYSNETIIEKI